jgi:hypothetical protein
MRTSTRSWASCCTKSDWRRIGGNCFSESESSLEGTDRAW